VLFNIDAFGWEGRQPSVLTTALKQSVLCVDYFVLHDILFLIMLNKIFFGAVSTGTKRTVTD